MGCGCDEIPKAQMGVCRWCGARMLWVRSAVSKKSMPLNPEGDPINGNVVIKKVGEGCKAFVLGPLDAKTYTGLKYTAHFATCPTPRGRKDVVK